MNLGSLRQLLTRVVDAGGRRGVPEPYLANICSQVLLLARGVGAGHWPTPLGRESGSRGHLGLIRPLTCSQLLKPGPAICNDRSTVLSSGIVQEMQYWSVTLSVRGKCTFDEVLVGLKFLHDNSLLHRDIKPENVLHNDAGEVRALWCSCIYMKQHATCTTVTAAVHPI